MMKKSSFIFIVFALILTSCSNSDDSVDVSGGILGSWKGVDVNYSTVSNITFDGKPYIINGLGEGYDVNYTITFTENPNKFIANGTYSVKLTTTGLGESRVDYQENLEFLTNGAWSKSNKELTVVSQDETDVFTILELTDTSLKMEVKRIEKINENGYNYLSEIILVATYIRL